MPTASELNKKAELKEHYDTWDGKTVETDVSRVLEWDVTTVCDWLEKVKKGSLREYVSVVQAKQVTGRVEF